MVASCLKYTDAVLKNFPTSVSVVLVTYGSAIFLNGPATFPTAVGSLLVAISALNYAQPEATGGASCAAGASIATVEECMEATLVVGTPWTAYERTDSQCASGSTAIASAGECGNGPINTLTTFTYNNEPGTEWPMSCFVHGSQLYFQGSTQEIIASQVGLGMHQVQLLPLGRAAHQRQDPYRFSPYDTAVFVLQTDKAARKWPADEGS